MNRKATCKCLRDVQQHGQDVRRSVRRVMSERGDEEP